MKAKFYPLISAITISAIAMGCSAPRYATAQSDIYYNQQQPAPQQQPYDDGQYSDQQPQQQDVDFNTFYDALSPYGTWEDDPDYGQVWVCNQQDFTPYYTGGNWAYSDAGWAWNSSYNWGWAPFHYGRWAYRNQWMWIPGYEWAPAWVNWRSGGDYYGWTPLGPSMSIGVGFGYADYIPADHWNFCQRAYIASPYFSNYCAGRGENINIIRNTTIINNVNVYRNTRFIAGPERGEVERYTGRINTVAIRDAARPGASVISRGAFNIYRPNVRPGNINTFNHGQAPARQNNFNQPYNNIGQRNNNNMPRPGNAPSSMYNNGGNVRVQNNGMPQNRGYANTPSNIGMQPRQNSAPQAPNQFAYNNRQQYQPQHQPQERVFQQQQQPARQYQAPQRPQYQPQVERQQYQQPQQARPQFQAQQPSRQPVYNNNRPSFEARQPQAQQTPRQQFQAPQRNNTASGNFRRR